MTRVSWTPCVYYSCVLPQVLEQPPPLSLKMSRKLPSSSTRSTRGRDGGKEELRTHLPLPSFRLVHTALGFQQRHTTYTHTHTARNNKENCLVPRLLEEGRSRLNSSLLFLLLFLDKNLLQLVPVEDREDLSSPPERDEKLASLTARVILMCVHKCVHVYDTHS